MALANEIDEYKKPGEIVRFRIGPKNAFGKGLETDIDGNTIFDLLETMGYRREVVIFGENKDTAVDFDLIESPDKGYYSVIDVTSNNEKVYEDSFIDVTGNADYDFYTPNITGEILNGIPPTAAPIPGDLFLVTGSTFNPDGTPFVVGTVVTNTAPSPPPATWVEASTSRPIDFVFSHQIGDLAGFTDLENNEVIFELLTADLLYVPAASKAVKLNCSPGTVPLSTLNECIYKFSLPEASAAVNLTVCTPLANGEHSPVPNTVNEPFLCVSA